ncbi:hypothetical protein M378DRAFT_903890 [Amanita muscaria Koide BX008]|uniref:Uncharacterized protein n=1 Tax=Amanita muscaria (strain Koide BX008) TaxID=946122 RepID=A0A0C2T352_AMAMK|nr:hypothetical protein M378DRAFT_903890 [Amanita muscaria Koide BX008]
MMKNHSRWCSVVFSLFLWSFIIGDLLNHRYYYISLHAYIFYALPPRDVDVKNLSSKPYN